MTTNRFGANTWIWVSPVNEAELARLAPKLAAWGFGGIELPIENIDDWDPQRAAEILADSGLTPFSCCAAMGPGRELVAASPEDLEVGRQYIRDAIDVTAELGAGVLMGPMYAAVGRTWRILDRGPVIDELVENLKPLADYAGERGVRLGMEALNRFETSVLNTLEQVIEVVDRVGSPHLGVALDTFHMNIEEKDPAAAIRAAGDRVVHVQASGSDRGAPGNGTVDWEATAAALADIGYDGAITIESFTSDNATIAVAASIWRQLEPTQDDIATTGLATLKRVFGG